MSKFPVFNATLFSFFQSIAFRDDTVLKGLRAKTALLSETNMQISPEQGQLMTLLTQLVSLPSDTPSLGAIEIGTFTGYSALSIARGLANNRTLIACDVNEKWTSIGQEFWEKDGIHEKIELKLAPALETLKAMESLHGTLDFGFIDADKGNYDAYYEGVLALLRPGGILLIDNIFWGGATADLTKQDADTVAIRELSYKVHKDERVDASLIPVADGVFVVRKR